MESRFERRGDERKYREKKGDRKNWKKWFNGNNVKEKERQDIHSEEADLEMMKGLTGNIILGYGPRKQR
ncbi:hypothetical protein DPMN_121033 [Dreissena polymorpha]|uniref:Uncharacterized protein n=1 Tax=Dreissena polymorpha TaxID=45954 RepID=A0A9D4GPR2_DREPO|nr:hypothetical protein DPMN_121033 [Dreissena polymorpha]